MIPDLDIYRSANVLVKRHGQDAPIEAAMRADAMLDKGDVGGHHARIPYVHLKSIDAAVRDEVREKSLPLYPCGRHGALL